MAGSPAQALRQRFLLTRANAAILGALVAARLAWVRLAASLERPGAS